MLIKPYNALVHERYYRHLYLTIMYQTDNYIHRPTFTSLIAYDPLEMSYIGEIPKYGEILKYGEVPKYEEIPK